jgi:hypothetical protein
VKSWTCEILTLITKLVVDVSLKNAVFLIIDKEFKCPSSFSIDELNTHFPARYITDFLRYAFGGGLLQESDRTTL